MDKTHRKHEFLRQLLLLGLKVVVLMEMNCTNYLCMYMYHSQEIGEVLEAFYGGWRHKTKMQAANISGVKS